MLVSSFMPNLSNSMALMAKEWKAQWPCSVGSIQTLCISKVRSACILVLYAHTMNHSFEICFSWSLKLVAGETMQFDELWGEKWLKKVCPHVNLKEVEWLSDCSAAAIPCGLLFRVWSCSCEYDGGFCEKCDPAKVLIDGDEYNVYSSPKDDDLLAFRREEFVANGER